MLTLSRNKKKRKKNEGEGDNIQEGTSGSNNGVLSTVEDDAPARVPVQGSDVVPTLDGIPANFAQIEVFHSVDCLVGLGHRTIVSKCVPPKFGGTRFDVNTLFNNKLQ
jgi:hypothetical protein